ncbi:DUF1850 domain-containing protein [Bhargavaea beijingensis]|uniref:DUF1850 domain-containing protein n=1 Tax=Bhargavaea beijingensis TaxID=426756 RepID=A0A1G7BPP9_9BACL|nr:DUF1850 domain-containing protein [Bhargavaea beijingensis]MCW1926752.1 DUF1850 domain-containing protein [Bhargavaea beijingensis]RSK36995.1 DUF1850 domain-containing protein [Bhargavaea beijingensis]SDE28670.1 hypothetical protein SAMN04488126_10656 [Bhargavaea beijingensis]
MRKAIGAAMIAAVLAAVMNVPIADSFVFTETRSETPAIHYIRQSDSDRFVIRYTHSIHLSDVIETYEVTKDRKIRLLKMEYEDLAIGLPGHAEEGETFTAEDGRYTLEYENRMLDSFVLYVADIDTDLEFRYDGRVYDLKKLLDRGSSYQFEVRKLSLLEFLKGVNTNGG